MSVGRFLTSGAAWALVPLLLLSCTRKPSLPGITYADSLEIVRENLEYRHERSEYFLLSPESPFRRDTTAPFLGLKWYPVNPHWRAQSVLHRYDRPEEVTVMGTGGEERQHLKYGYFSLLVPGPTGNAVTIKINVYKFSPADTLRFARYGDLLNLWFTDETTGGETYGVGRYIDIGNEHPDPGHLYIVDFNKAYNPYCAYNDSYSCAIPPKEDNIDLPVHAGEKLYHTDH